MPHRRTLPGLLILPLIPLLLGACGGGGGSGATDATADARILSTMKRYEIDAAKHPLARCNDGSIPIFYFRPGIGRGQTSG